MGDETAWKVIWVLHSIPGGVRLRDIVRFSKKSKPAVLKVLKRLQAEGRVQRTLGGYSRLPSEDYLGPMTLWALLGKLSDGVQKKALMRKPTSKRLPRSVLEQAAGKYLSKTPVYSLKPLSPLPPTPPSWELDKTIQVPSLIPQYQKGEPSRNRTGLTERQGEQLVRKAVEPLGEDVAKKLGWLIGFDYVGFMDGIPHLMIVNHPSVLWKGPGYRFSRTALLPTSREKALQFRPAGESRDLLLDILRKQAELAKLGQL